MNTSIYRSHGQAYRTTRRFGTRASEEASRASTAMGPPFAAKR